jgi:hypothetical protein
VLEIKCPWNKGKPESALPYPNVPWWGLYKFNSVYPYCSLESAWFLTYEMKNWFQSLLSNGSTCTATPRYYMPQVQGLMVGLYKLNPVDP